MAVKEKTLPVLIKEADDIFSTFIRLRDSDEKGIVRCFICSAPLPWRQSQNMHFIDRDQMPTRYSEINCHAGCGLCNCFDMDHKNKYEVKMVVLYGASQVEALYLKAKRSLQKFMRFELEELIEFYSLKVKELKAKK